MDDVKSAQEDKPAASVADILDRAADLIEPEGAWTQRCYGKGNGPLDIGGYGCLCLYGAIAEASGGDDFASESIIDAAMDAVAALAIPEADHSGQIIKWNDAPERTQAEVVAALRQAAERSRALGEQA